MSTNITQLVRQLEHEREAIDNALAALAALNSPQPKGGRRGRRKMSASARRRISLAQKKRWREQKAKAKA